MKITYKEVDWATYDILMMKKERKNLKKWEQSAIFQDCNQENKSFMNT